MGNCFTKPKSDNFSGSGQTLANSASNNPAPKPVITSTTTKPASASASVSRPAVAASYAPTPKQGRVVGGASPGPGSDDPRVAAAMAAEERLKSSRTAATKGKLGKQLDAQKAQTHNKVLDESSREALLVRNADANAEVRVWN